MISQYEVPGLIQTSFRKELSPVDDLMHSLSINVSLDLYESIHALSGITKKASLNRNYALLRKCFLLAEHLYSNGDRLVRSVLENVYIYSLSSCVAGDNKLGVCYKSLMPADFYSVYVHQMINSRI